MTTNSYGAGLARFLTDQAIPIREVIRPRRAQRRRGKSNPIDAYAAAQQPTWPAGSPHLHRPDEKDSLATCAAVEAS